MLAVTSSALCAPTRIALPARSPAMSSVGQAPRAVNRAVALPAASGSQSASDGTVSSATASKASVRVWRMRWLLTRNRLLLACNSSVPISIRSVRRDRSAEPRIGVPRSMPRNRSISRCPVICSAANWPLLASVKSRAPGHRTQNSPGSKLRAVASICQLIPGCQATRPVADKRPSRCTIARRSSSIASVEPVSLSCRSAVRPGGPSASRPSIAYCCRLPLTATSPVVSST